MSDTILKDMYEVILDRKQNPMEGSYTCYLFEKGLDKILKKIGEESAETIIAAKNDVPEDTVGEINEDVLAEMEKRSRKIGNLKKMHVSDHNT